MLLHTSSVKKRKEKKRKERWSNHQTLFRFDSNVSRRWNIKPFLFYIFLGRILLYNIEEIFSRTGARHLNLFTDGSWSPRSRITFQSTDIDPFDLRRSPRSSFSTRSFNRYPYLLTTPLTNFYSSCSAKISLIFFEYHKIILP